MNDKLTVIIPCYNCQDTLEEALASIYTQNLHIPYEVVMINDASTDNTWSLMNELAQKYPEVKCFQHEKNQGGGATRNTAVSQANGNLIFCLDSDDILAPGTLDQMVKLLLEKQCDGVGIGTSIKFEGRDKNKIAYTNKFGYVGQIIPVESLFHKKDGPFCPLYSTFLITKKAFELIGGYPTDHGFDTQGMAFRFLFNGLKAYTCPEAIYWHRINFHKSYYAREYESGKVNHNWFNIFEEFLFLFNPQVQDLILNYDLNKSTQTIDIAVALNKQPLHQNFRDLIQNGVKEKYEARIKSGQTQNPLDLYWLGLKKRKEKNVEEARNYLTKAYQAGLVNDHVYQNLLELGYSFSETERAKAEAVITRLTNYQKQGSQLFILIRIKNKILRIIKKCLNIG